MTGPGVADGQGGPGDADRARARRAVARRHHPDLGGDPAVFVEEMARLDRPTTGRTGAQAPRPTSEPLLPVIVVSPRRRALGALRRTGVRLVGDVRRRLPRGVPGARRYGRL